METYNFKPHVKGDTYRGTEFTITIGGDPADLSNADIKLQLRLQPNHPASHELSISSGHVSITDASAGVFTLNKTKIDFPAGNYYYDCQITFADGSIKTYFGGRFPIIQDVTR